MKTKQLPTIIKNFLKEAYLLKKRGKGIISFFPFDDIRKLRIQIKLNILILTLLSSA